MYNFQTVAIKDRRGEIGRTRNDFKVALDRDLAAIEADLGNQGGQAGRRDLSFLAVQKDFNHLFAIYRRKALYRVARKGLLRLNQRDTRSASRFTAGFMSARLTSIYVLNGPNLNLLGVREPEIYGHDTLADIESRCADLLKDTGFDLVFRQSNHEGQLIDWIQEARTEGCALIINPAAYTHTSVGLLDALKALSIPVFECHLSNPHAREPFRHHSYVSLAAKGIIAGCGAFGYELAIRAVLNIVKQ